MNATITKWALVAFTAATLVACDSKGAKEPSAESQTITVYSARKAHLIEPLFEKFTAETGIEVQYLTDSAGPILSKLKAEGENTPADLLLTTDAGNLWHAAQENLLAPINSVVLDQNIPSHLKDPENRWFGLSQRARVFVYNTNAVDPSKLSTYEALGDEVWEGRLCLRTSKKVYNQSLVATMIEEDGEDVVREVLTGWVRNLAEAPFSNDTKAMNAVAAGACDVTIVNTYYYGRLMKTSPELPLAIFWPNQAQGERGIHVNVSGGGVTKYAKQPHLAQQLLEWLSAEQAQYMFADLNQEFPVNPKVSKSAEVAAWGDFREDQVNLSVAGQRQAEAIMLMDQVGYK